MSQTLFKIHSEFAPLDKRYNAQKRDEVIKFLFQRENWLYEPNSRSWRKIVNKDDTEFPPDEDTQGMSVAFVKEPKEGPDPKHFIDWWYRIYIMADSYLREKSIYYHPPIHNESMPAKALYALLIACETYHNNLENKVFKKQEFVSYLNL